LSLHNRLSSLLVHQHGPSQQYQTAAKLDKALGCLFLGEIPYKPELHLNAEHTRTPVMLDTKESPERLIYQSVAQKLSDYTEILEQFGKSQQTKSARLV